MSGLIEWSNSVRFAMANDSGRKLFQDQVQTHGFAFLDNYLDNILSGPIYDPLIELVKTPGKKKAARTKVFGSHKLQVLEDREGSKENQPPTKLLLDTEGRKFVRLDQTFDVQQVEATTHDPVARLLPGRTDLNDLSVIAEDDENVESRYLDQRQPSASISSLSDKNSTGTGSPSLPASFSMVFPKNVNISESKSDVFHSITSDAHTLIQDPNQKNLTIVVPNEGSIASLEEQSLLEKKLPLATSDELGDQAARGNSPNSYVVPSEISAPLRNPERPVVCLKGIQKFDFTPFSALPAPIPLRKSIREISLGVNILGATTPGAPLGGKRTSWLQKVREANALEVTNKQVAVQALSANVINPLKRNSDEMLATPEMTELDDGKRQSKSVKIQHQDSGRFVAALELPHPSSSRIPTQDLLAEKNGMLDLLKKTVEVLGAKVGKSMDSSSGTKTVPGVQTAVDALAEARAAAEVRVAERQQEEEEITQVLADSPIVPSLTNASTVPGTPAYESAERRLSVSDLFPSIDESVKMKDRSLAFSFPSVIDASNDHGLPHDGGTTTTPPISPPPTCGKNVALSVAPIFNRPSPVFVPPDYPDKHFKGSAVDPRLVQSPFMEAETAANFPVPSTLSSALRSPRPLSKQSTLESMGSEVIFDDTDVPAWMPNTQDTEYLSESQPHTRHQDALDEDDSWPVDEKLSAGVQWTFGHAKEDSLTWSTLPSQSQGPDTGSLYTCEDHHVRQANEPTTSHVEIISRALDLDADSYHGEEYILKQNNEGATHGETFISDAESLEKNETQAQTSQLNMGFLNQASKLLSSALGTNKKGKPEVRKVLQMAAVAAKKQQEENDKKVARLKEMENRRQLAIQRKADEEKARVVEQEKKIKDEGERRKREREEVTEKRLLKTIPKKEEDNTKKRKLLNEGEKKEPKKPLPKTVFKPSIKLPSVLASSVAAVSLHGASTSKTSAPKLPKSSSGTVARKGKDITRQPPPDDDVSQPSQLVQVQMAARVKAQLHAAAIAVPEPPVASESIELPEINSEYSDSEDEDRPKSFPEWAQSPELREALQVQSTINPDDIFGAVRPLRMEELFKTRTSRFRARTSSANWTGTDRLTTEEEQEYIRRMGYK